MGFIPFPRVLVFCEIQSVSTRIWTRVVMSISYDDNHYTTGIYIHIYEQTSKTLLIFLRATRWLIGLIRDVCMYLSILIHIIETFLSVSVCVTWSLPFSLSIYMYISSSSSCCTASTDLPNPLPTTFLYRLQLPAGLQGYILYRHRAVVCKLELVVLPLLVHVKGSTGVCRLWVRPYFSSCVPYVWFV